MKMMKTENKTLILLGGDNKKTGITCRNSILLMAAVRMGRA
jgi:hypothetical protein